MTQEAAIVTIRPERETMTRQRLPNFVGVSQATAGSAALAMNVVIIPAGAAAEAHLHRGYETAIYLLSGRVQTFYGDGLGQSVINEAGDFIFIPANVPHQPVNLSQTEAAQAIVARNDPNEQESVESYAPAGMRQNLQQTLQALTTQLNEKHHALDRFAHQPAATNLIDAEIDQLETQIRVTKARLAVLVTDLP
ncbi:MAG: cupin domain-containing protein [Anaerolineales bacterium]|nr:cupin domain-containing protein [Anaerolineales bacterium]